MKRIKYRFMIRKNLIKCQYLLWAFKLCTKLDSWLSKRSVEIGDYDQRNRSLKRISDSESYIEELNEMIKFYKAILPIL